MYKRQGIRATDDGETAYFLGYTELPGAVRAELDLTAQDEEEDEIEQWHVTAEMGNGCFVFPFENFYWRYTGALSGEWSSGVVEAAYTPVSYTHLENWDGSQVLKVECRDPEGAEGAGSECALYFDPDDHGLLRAELSYDGAVVLTAEFTDFTKEMTSDDTTDNADLG